MPIDKYVLITDIPATFDVMQLTVRNYREVMAWLESNGFKVVFYADVFNKYYLAIKNGRGECIYDYIEFNKYIVVQNNRIVDVLGATFFHKKYSYLTK